jgi:hypothetical protein
MKEQDEFLQKKFAEATSPDRGVRKLQEQMQDRAYKQNVSPFSPAQRVMLDTVSSQGVPIEIGRGTQNSVAPFKQQAPL